MKKTTLVHTIGWASIGIGIVAFAAPRGLGRALGIGERPALARALGGRDLVIGVGLVAAPDPAPWLRARLAADVGDSLLHVAGALTGTFRRGRSLATATGAAALAVVDYALLARLDPARSA